MFNKGDRVKLNEYGLNFLFPSLVSNRYRDMAASKTFIVLGHSRDKKCTRVMIEGGSSNSSLTYSNAFLQSADKGKLTPGQIVTVYEDPLAETKPEGKAKLISLIELLPHVPAERWWVQFVDDDFHNPVDRLIKIGGATR
jgi:hypothetical protein